MAEIDSDDDVDLVGAKVRISGLKATPEINDCLGTVQSFSEENGRYTVRVEKAFGIFETMALKPSALVKVEDAGAPNLEANSPTMVDVSETQGHGMPANFDAAAFGGEDLSGDGGVLKKVVVAGDAASGSPPSGSIVSVHYVGNLARDGSKFDSSRDRPGLFEFDVGVGRVIKGWDLGIVTMHAGERCVLACRSDYAYGEKGVPGKIPPDSTLIFEVELFSWRAKEPAAAEAPAEADPDLIGARVKIVGIKARPELNGLAGNVESYNQETGRYNVKIFRIQSAEVMALKPDNLKKTGAAKGGDDPLEDDDVTYEAPPDLEMVDARHVRVECNGNRLKLTLKQKLLKRPFGDVVLLPFLSAYSKKLGRAELITPDLVETVLVDDVELADFSLPASIVLLAKETVDIEIILKEEENPPAVDVSDDPKGSGGRDRLVLAEQVFLHRQWVEVHGLTSEAAAPMNGRRGKVVDFNGEKNRYDVEVDGAEQKTINVKFDNLRLIGEDLSKLPIGGKQLLLPGQWVEVHSLLSEKAQRNLNGLSGKVVGFHADTDRYDVNLEGATHIPRDQQTISVRYTNLNLIGDDLSKLPVGGTVKVHGLRSETSSHLNSKEGRVVRYIVEKERYQLDLEGIKVMKNIKPANLCRLSPLELLASMERRSARHKLGAADIKRRLEESYRKDIVVDPWGRIALHVDPLVIGSRRLKVDCDEVHIEKILDDKARKEAAVRLASLREDVEKTLLPACDDFEEQYRAANSYADGGEWKKNNPVPDNSPTIDDIWESVLRQCPEPTREERERDAAKEAERRAEREGREEQAGK